MEQPAWSHSHCKSLLKTYLFKLEFNSNSTPLSTPIALFSECTAILNLFLICAILFKSNKTIFVLLLEIYFIPFGFYAPQDFVCVLCDILNIVSVNCLKCPLLIKYVLT